MITDQTSSQDYIGNGSTSTPYVIPFRYDNVDWLTVYRITAGVRTLLARGADYNVTGANMVTTAAIPNTSTLHIERNVPPLQQLSPLPNTALPSQNLVKALDQQVMAIQDIRRGLQETDSRALRVPATETIPPLPPKVNRADTVLGFDAQGNPLVVSEGLITNIAAVQAAAASAHADALSAAASAAQAATIPASTDFWYNRGRIHWFWKQILAMTAQPSPDGFYINWAVCGDSIAETLSPFQFLWQTLVRTYGLGMLTSNFRVVGYTIENQLVGTSQSRPDVTGTAVLVENDFTYDMHGTFYRCSPGSTTTELPYFGKWRRTSRSSASGSERGSPAEARPSPSPKPGLSASSKSSTQPAPAMASLTRISSLLTA